MYAQIAVIGTKCALLYVCVTLGLCCSRCVLLYTNCCHKVCSYAAPQDVCTKDSTLCHKLQHAATNCSKLQQTAIHCTPAWQAPRAARQDLYLRNTMHKRLQHTARQCTPARRAPRAAPQDLCANSREKNPRRAFCQPIACRAGRKRVLPRIKLLRAAHVCI